MNEQAVKQLLSVQYMGYVEILDQRGVPFESISVEEFLNMSIPDEKRVVNAVRDLARTPSR